MYRLKLVPEQGLRRRVKPLSQHQWETHCKHTSTIRWSEHRRGQFALLSICLKPASVCVCILKQWFMKLKMYLLTWLTVQSASLIAKHLPAESEWTGVVGSEFISAACLETVRWSQGFLLLLFKLKAADYKDNKSKVLLVIKEMWIRFEVMFI